MAAPPPTLSITFRPLLSQGSQEPASNLSHQVPPGFGWGGVSLLWRGQVWGRGSGFRGSGVSLLPLSWPQ